MHRLNTNLSVAKYLLLDQQMFTTCTNEVGGYYVYAPQKVKLYFYFCSILPANIKKGWQFNVASPQNRL